MSTGVRVASYALALAGVFGASLGVGHAVGPLSQPGSPSRQVPAEQSSPMTTDNHPSHSAQLPSGLAGAPERRQGPAVVSTAS